MTSTSSGPEGIDPAATARMLQQACVLNNQLLQQIEQMGITTGITTGAASFTTAAAAAASGAVGAAYQQGKS